MKKLMRLRNIILVVCALMPLTAWPAKLSPDYQRSVRRLQKNVNLLSSLDLNYRFRTLTPLKQKDFYVGMDLKNCDRRLTEGRIKITYSNGTLYAQMITDVSNALCDDGTSSPLDKYTPYDLQFWIPGNEVAYHTYRMNPSSISPYIAITSASQSLSQNAVLSSAIPPEVLDKLKIARVDQVQKLYRYDEVRFPIVDKLSTPGLVQFSDKYPADAVMAQKGAANLAITTQKLIVDTNIGAVLEASATMQFNESKTLDLGKTVKEFIVLKDFPVADSITLYTQGENNQLLPFLWLILDHAQVNGEVSIPDMPKISGRLDQRDPAAQHEPFGP